MKPSVAELSEQPIGYWTGAAHKAVIGYIGKVQGQLGVTQRHWMVLNILAKSPTGLDRHQLKTSLQEYLTPEIGDASTLDIVVDDLQARGWIELTVSERFVVTPAGSDGQQRIAQLAPGIRAQIHDGITDDDYAVTVTVLRRMIANVGGNSDLP